jgi:hypothetical protein
VTCGFRAATVAECVPRQGPDTKLLLLCCLASCRYSVGMAISAYQKGRMLLISADKAPATGCILFESVDGGRRWENISDDVADSIAALTEHAPEVLEQAPLAMFVPGRSDLCTLVVSVSGSCWQRSQTRHAVLPFRSLICLTALLTGCTTIARKVPGYDCAASQQCRYDKQITDLKGSELAAAVGPAVRPTTCCVQHL